MDFSFVANTPLFHGASAQEIGSMLICLEAERRAFEKDAVIYHVGERVEALGLVLTGSVHIENYDIHGNRVILDRVTQGQVFAETYACLPTEPLMVDVTAAEHTELLFLHVARLFQESSTDCVHCTKLLRNLLVASAQKNLILSRRSLHTTPKTIREKLLSYLSFQAVKAGCPSFTIPFNRQQLADYLGVDRSTLSKEMGKMRDEGLLIFQKNQFELRNEPVK